MFGPLLPPSASGIEPRVSAADRARERRRAAEKVKASSAPSGEREPDESMISPVAGLDAPEQARTVKGNADEEAHDDRQEHGLYTSRGGRGTSSSGEERPHLDVSG